MKPELFWLQPGALMKGFENKNQYIKHVKMGIQLHYVVEGTNAICVSHICEFPAGMLPQAGREHIMGSRSGMNGLSNITNCRSS